MATKTARALTTGDVITIHGFGKVIVRNVKKYHGKTKFDAYYTTGEFFATFILEYAVPVEFHGNLNIR